MMANYNLKDLKELVTLDRITGLVDPISERRYRGTSPTRKRPPP